MTDTATREAHATLYADATADLVLDGQTHAIRGTSDADARQKVIHLVTEKAKDQDAAVLLSTRDRFGRGQLRVQPEGVVEAVGAFVPSNPDDGEPTRDVDFTAQTDLLGAARTPIRTSPPAEASQLNLLPKPVPTPPPARSVRRIADDEVNEGPPAKRGRTRAPRRTSVPSPAEAPTGSTTSPVPADASSTPVTPEVDPERVAADVALLRNAMAAGSAGTRDSTVGDRPSATAPSLPTPPRATPASQLDATRPVAPPRAAEPQLGGGLPAVRISPPSDASTAVAAATATSALPPAPVDVAPSVAVSPVAPSSPLPAASTPSPVRPTDAAPTFAERMAAFEREVPRPPVPIVAEREVPRPVMSATPVTPAAPVPPAAPPLPDRPRFNAAPELARPTALTPPPPPVAPQPLVEPKPVRAGEPVADRASFLVAEPPPPSATRGWRGALARAGVSVRPSRSERLERHDLEIVSRHWPTPRTIAVVNGKGGANKTPTTALLAAVFARNGGSGVLAWDNNDARGTLGWRTDPGDHDSTTRDLLARTDWLLTPEAKSSDLSAYVHHQSADRYDVLRSNPLILSGEHRISPEEFDELHAVARKYFRLIVIDSGNDESAPRWRRMVDRADQLVVATTALGEHAEAGALLLEALSQRDERSRQLSANAVVIVSQSEKTAGLAPAKRMADAFGSIARAAVAIPFDQALHSGRIRFESLEPDTQRAWLAATALAGEQL